VRVEAPLDLSPPIGNPALSLISENYLWFSFHEIGSFPTTWRHFVFRPDSEPFPSQICHLCDDQNRTATQTGIGGVLAYPLHGRFGTWARSSEYLSFRVLSGI